MSPSERLRCPTLSAGCAPASRDASMPRSRGTRARRTPAWRCSPEFAAGFGGLSAGEDVLLLTWLHEAERAVLEVHPRDDPGRPLAGVFSTRSADRPNPVGLHRVRLLAIVDGRWLHVAGLEAIDGTPVIDIKPVLS